MFSSLCGVEEVRQGSQKYEDVPSMVFCGFTDPFESFREQERDEENVTATNELRSPDRENENNFHIVGESYEECDDDSSVVSDWAASNLPLLMTLLITFPLLPLSSK